MLPACLALISPCAALHAGIRPAVGGVAAGALGGCPNPLRRTAFCVSGMRARRRATGSGRRRPAHPSTACASMPVRQRASGQRGRLRKSVLKRISLPRSSPCLGNSTGSFRMPRVLLCGGTCRPASLWIIPRAWMPPSCIRRAGRRPRRARRAPAGRPAACPCAPGTRHPLAARAGTRPTGAAPCACRRASPRQSRRWPRPPGIFAHDPPGLRRIRLGRHADARISLKAPLAAAGPASGYACRGTGAVPPRTVIFTAVQPGPSTPASGLAPARFPSPAAAPPVRPTGPPSPPPIDGRGERLLGYQTRPWL